MDKRFSIMWLRQQLHALCFPTVEHANHIAAFAFLKTLQESEGDSRQHPHSSTVELIRQSVFCTKSVRNANEIPGADIFSDIDRFQVGKLECFIWSNKHKNAYIAWSMCISFSLAVFLTGNGNYVWLVALDATKQVLLIARRKKKYIYFLIMLLVACRTKWLNTLLMWGCAISRMVPSFFCCCLLLTPTEYFLLPHHWGLALGPCGLIWNHFRKQFTLLIIFLQQ